MPIVAPGPSAVQFNTTTGAPIRATSSMAPNPARNSLQVVRAVTSTASGLAATATVKGR